MSFDQKEENLSSAPPKKRSRLVTTILGAITVLVFTWIFVGLGRYTYMINRIISLIASNFSVLRLTLLVSFGGTMLSVPFLLRRGHRTREPNGPVPLPINQRTTAHPLMMTPRPARDSSFVFRKTKKRGRISRNRAGERLPLTGPD